MYTNISLLNPWISVLVSSHELVQFIAFVEHLFSLSRLFNIFTLLFHVVLGKMQAIIFFLVSLSACGKDRRFCLQSKIYVYSTSKFFLRYQGDSMSVTRTALSLAT